MPGKWKIPPAEIERRRKEKGLRLSNGVTEHRLPSGLYYTVKSESNPSKQYKIEWNRYKLRWTCNCPNATHQITPTHCSHEHALSISLQRGTIHGIDSLVAARKRYHNGGEMGRK